jgi:hypothetical protein
VVIPESRSLFASEISGQKAVELWTPQDARRLAVCWNTDMPIARLHTPLVPPPNSTASRARHDAVELQSPIVVVSPLGDLELESGEVTIGRSPKVELSFEDPLISRHHARIMILADGGVVVEDLSSTNGVFVNGARVGERSERLSAGDRLLVGTTEIGLFSATRSGKLKIPPRAPAAEPKAIARIVATPRAVLEPIPSVLDDFDSDTTALRSDAFGIVAQLADRLLASGRKEEAMRVLGENLRAVVLSVSVDLRVSERVLEQATAQAFKLFDWSRSKEWVEYVLELHVRAQRLLRAEHFELLSSAMRLVGDKVDANLIDQYIESLCSQWSQMSGEERALFTRLAMLGVPG